jgi:hypothetical protein
LTVWETVSWTHDPLLISKENYQLGCFLLLLQSQYILPILRLNIGPADATYGWLFLSSTYVHASLSNNAVYFLSYRYRHQISFQTYIDHLCWFKEKNTIWSSNKC